MSSDHSARCAQSRRKRLILGAYTDKTCPTTGKRQFATDALAQTELDKVQKLRAGTPQNTHRETKFYRCGSCTLFHLSSQNR